MIRTYREHDFEELLRLRCLLYPKHSTQELRDEVTAFFYHPHANRFRNYDLWTSLVYGRGDGRLGGFIEIGFVSAVDYEEKLEDFRNTAYGDEVRQRLAANLPIPVVESWYVDEDLRRKRIGAQLMLHAAQWVREHGCLFILSDTDDFRDVSKKAHQSLGFDTYHIDAEGCHYFFKRLI
ncbi:MAG: GNAT family N-acetyltransferase [Planctomycetaceae bacterium]|nr:GNAT family N-acetyltransferase [Planctomycetaceae bacterium]